MPSPNHELRACSYANDLDDVSSGLGDSSTSDSSFDL